MISKKTMELNAAHPIVRALKDKAEADKTDKTVRDLTFLLFDTSLLVSGFALDDPSGYAARIHRMIKLGLCVTDDDVSAEPEADAAAEQEGDDGQSKMEEVD